MLKILTVVGARPQFIKAAAFSHAAKKHSHIAEIIVHTGQHYDKNLSEIFFTELNIPHPTYHLEIGSASHGQQTGQMISRLELVMMKEKPGLVLVYGDTNSTLAAALAAVKLQIPIIHVEAGVRSHNLHQAEEINRILTDRISDLLLVPTHNATNNLIKEGISPDKIHVVGDIMYDLVKLFESKSANSTLLKQLGITSKNYLVATIHRAENTDHEHLKDIINALNNLSEFYNIVLPLHPRTHKALLNYQLTISHKIQITEPLGFVDMMTLTKNAKVMITDSGGLQKEAFYHHVPCITVREETEWTELLHNGWNTLLPPNQIHLLSEHIERLWNLDLAWQNPYGNGQTSEKILSILQDQYDRTALLESTHSQ